MGEHSVNCCLATFEKIFLGNKIYYKMSETENNELVFSET